MPIRTSLQFKVTDSGCFEVTSHIRKNGYPCIMRGRFRMQLSRFIWEECFGLIPEGFCVLHRCDNPKCINPEHLFLGTHADNRADCVAKGRGARGEKDGLAKLTEGIIRQIRRRYCPNGGPNSGRALAREFGVGPTTIGNIIAGRTWRHVDAESEVSGG